MYNSKTSSLRIKNAPLTAQRACPLCGEDDAVPVYSWGSFQFYSDSLINNKMVDLHTVQCRKCLCVYMNPCYTEEGFNILFKEAGGSYSAGRGLRDDVPDMLVREGVVRPGSYVLDAGCYNGGQLGRFPTNVNCIGVDVDAPAIEQANKKYPNFEFICSPLELFRTRQPANVIMMLHVLEHLLDPVSVLKNLYSNSAPDATLVLEVPVIDTIINQCTVGFFTPQHVTHFSKTTLKNMLSATGWAINTTTSMANYNGYRVFASKAKPGLQITVNFNDRHSILDMVASVNQKASEVEKRINDLLVGCDHIAIWGAGMHLEALYQKTTLFHNDRGLEYTIVDSSTTLQGTTWRGHAIYSPSTMRDFDWTHGVLVVSSYASTPSIVQNAKALGIPEKKIAVLYNEFEK